MIELPSIQEHGWFSDGDIFWMDKALPDDVDSILEENVNNIEYENEDFGSDVESESDEEDNWFNNSHNFTIPVWVFVKIYFFC